MAHFYSYKFQQLTHKKKKTTDPRNFFGETPIDMIASIVLTSTTICTTQGGVMGVGQVIRSLFEGDAYAMGGDTSKDCNTKPVIQNVFGEFQNTFEFHTKEITTQASRGERSINTTLWGDNGWASSTIIGPGVSTTTTFSKWVNVDGKDYQIQAWRYTVDSQTMAVSYYMTTHLEYSLNLYDDQGKLLTYLRNAGCSDGLFGNYEERAAIRIMQAAFSTALHQDMPTVAVNVPTGKTFFSQNGHVTKDLSKVM